MDVSMIAIEGLTKRFGPIVAVDGITLNVDRGEVLGFLGPNGAGKSTTMRMVTGYLAPSGGSVKVCGFDVERDVIDARKRTGYLPEGAPLYGDMTPEAFLDFVARARGLSGADKEKRIAAAIETVQLRSVIGRPIDTLSKGFKRRVGLAQAILHDPDVLILDEPTDGLDPNQKHQVRDLIRSMAKDKVIVISTHILEEVEAVCTRAVIIAQGRIVFDGTPGELQRKSLRHNAVSLHVEQAKAAEVRAELEKLDAVGRVEEEPAVNGFTTLVALPKNGKTILPAVSSLVQSHALPVDEIYVERGHLNDVFRQLTTAN
jgi:ABC-2 type transport system ATP-binding protein